MRLFAVPSDSTLTLFIPDLFGFQSILSGLSAEEISQLPKIKLPVLEKWLTRGMFEASNNQDDLIFSELGLDEYDNKEKPFAALSLLAEMQSEIEINKSSYWLRADPINLQADRDTAILTAHEELNLTQAEADTLVSLINKHFIDEPWQLYSFAPHRWYLRLDKPTSFKTTPLEKVLGGDINEYSATGEDANYWHKIINELQMLLHGSNINFERDSRNILTINSLWLWGGGFLPENKLNSSYDKIITNNLIYSGVGYHCGFDVLPVNEKIQQHIHSGSVFILEQLTEHVRNRDLYSFVKVLNEIEKNFLVTFNNMLLDGRINKIKILTDKGSFTVTKKYLRRWWKRVKPFSGFRYE